MTLTDVLAQILPVPGEMITCGNRADLPRKQRVHKPIYMGWDWANKGAEGIVPVEVHVCIRCGKDMR